MKEASSRNSGMALLVTLLIMVVLAVLIHQFTFSTRVHLTSAAVLRDQLQAELIADSGIETTRALLIKESKDFTDEKIGDEQDKGTENDETELVKVFDALRLQALAEEAREDAMSAFPEDDRKVEIEIGDAYAKLGINDLIAQDGSPNLFLVEQMRRLLRLFGFEDDELDAMMDPLLDWLDADDDRRPEGAENADYESRSDAYLCRNGPLRSLGELTLVKGWEAFWEIRREDGPSLADCLTIAPTEGRINVNTAGPVILQSLSEMIDEPILDEIVSRREELPFEDAADFFLLVDFLPEPEKRLMSNYIQTDTDLLVLHCEGTYHRATATVEALVKKNEGAFDVMARRIE
jgi:general secretion pathway protein K